VTMVWVDASSGASGDMLLGALLGAGVPLEALQDAVDAVTPEPATLSVEQVTRAGFAATRCHVEVVDSAHHRTWRDVRALLLDSALDEPVRDLALRVFERLAAAEATVHGGDPMDVHFHEVGALDAIADVVGVCAGFVHLGADRVVVSPVASVVSRAAPGAATPPGTPTCCASSSVRRSRPARVPRASWSWRPTSTTSTPGCGRRSSPRSWPPVLGTRG